ncbi:hypothetical protein [Legionella hackeliae]|uniref:Uncharacterized protein n=1 Tax=Legionella hackeliae TaxID=449 RepID=A0A0A8UP52_LEGHA|nr:hypothetical protein [Legionella hackeliae]KTD13827.1 hypothetical protein Lhac_0671 [Legionella hackeliae]CEK10528.1 protein of unknown function [Legionella hackeliae]STX47266.1 Uncharacterised protein [Legionella hackeliae]
MRGGRFLFRFSSVSKEGYFVFCVTYRGTDGEVGSARHAIDKQGNLYAVDVDTSAVTPMPVKTNENWLTSITNYYHKNTKDSNDVLKDALISKIDDYLKWRENKDTPEDRGYTLGLFTRLRHLSNFGKKRAESLKMRLQGASSEQVIGILKEHFEENSRLNNHSLDTYLLEAIQKHKHVLNITENFNLGDKNDRAALREKIEKYEEKSSGPFASL